MEPTSQVSYLTQDHLGSPRVITNENGAVTSRKDFMAYGEEAASSNRVSGSGGNGYDPAETRKDYTGYEKDSETGLEYAQARYYNPTHGRYTSIDPMTASATIRDPQTFNRYSYVLNSPYKFVDPLGLLSQNTGACGQWCNNSGTGPAADVDGSAFHGRDATLDWSQQQTAPPDNPPPCARLEKEKKLAEARNKNKSGGNKKPAKPASTPSGSDPPLDPDAIKVTTDISGDLKIGKISVNYITTDETGQVPVGGFFSITYEFYISTPQEGDSTDLGSYGSLQATDSGAFAATENLKQVSTNSKTGGVKGTATKVIKTEIFQVLPDKNSNIGRSGGTRAINFFVVAQNPNSAGGGFVCENSNSTPGRYIEVRIPPRNR